MGDDEITNSSVTDSINLPKGGYGLSGRIMLTAIVMLFAVVVLMVCLHIYARWYLHRSRQHQLRRRRRRGSRTTLIFYSEEPSSAAASRGLDAALLGSLPVFLYSAQTHPHVVECAVCLSEFEENEKVRVLPKCNHGFHLDCIDMWFHSHSTCPLCRSPVEPVVPSRGTRFVVEKPTKPTNTRGCANATAGRQEEGVGAAKGDDRGAEDARVRGRVEAEFTRESGVEIAGVGSVHVVEENSQLPRERSAGFAGCGNESRGRDERVGCGERKGRVDSGSKPGSNAEISSENILRLSQVTRPRRRKRIKQLSATCQTNSGLKECWWHVALGKLFDYFE
ncbi:hypothetical protein RHSIM_Rhsim02G0007100 [Rhododendron simsii]|uniref:RING-type E3 ubiquitin transferase n=1 Tax=Rhododendron simsii TaxID=118357 RepID=A0A834H9T4_RHOSS|nr:hypothetical protein RHSIM_Rhsim02G0007100 [Rhododendron simsii]